MVSWHIGESAIDLVARLRQPRPLNAAHARIFCALFRIRRVMPPIACSLAVDQLSAQRESLLPGLADFAVQRSPLPSGIRLRFAATAARMRQIDTVVRRESVCCPFLEFRVGLALGGSSLTLDVTGPEGTAELLAELLDPAIAA